MRRYPQDRAGGQPTPPPNRGSRYGGDDDDHYRRYSNNNNNRYHRDSSSPYPRRERDQYHNHHHDSSSGWGSPAVGQSSSPSKSQSPAQPVQDSWDSIAVNVPPLSAGNDDNNNNNNTKARDNFSTWDSLSAAPAPSPSIKENDTTPPQQTKDSQQQQDPWAAFANNNNEVKETTTTATPQSPKKDPPPQYSFLNTKTISWWTLPSSQSSALAKDYKDVFSSTSSVLQQHLTARKRLDEWTILGLETSVMSLRTSAIEAQQQQQLVTRLSSDN